jgi:hypothetical protein
MARGHEPCQSHGHSLPQIRGIRRQTVKKNHIDVIQAAVRARFGTVAATSSTRHRRQRRSCLSCYEGAYSRPIEACARLVAEY